jgi:CRP-like cAMP-binding protein
MFSLPDFLTHLREKAAADGQWQVEMRPKGTELLRQGERCDRLLVLQRGLVKLTYLTPGGDEWIKSFVTDQGLFGSLDEGVSRFGAWAIEPCEVATLPTCWANDMIRSDPAFSLEVAAFSQWLVTRKQQREEALLCDSAETRYRNMLEDEPALLARLPQGDIARFLRVTPIAFSRIKRRVSPRVVSGHP